MAYHNNSWPRHVCWVSTCLCETLPMSTHDFYHPLHNLSMMTSSNGNIFRVTGHLCGEFTGLRWIPRTKASDAELWCFLWCARLSKHSRGWSFETLSHPLWRHGNVQNISGNTNDCYDNNTTEVSFRQILLLFLVILMRKSMESICVEYEHCDIWG